MFRMLTIRINCENILSNPLVSLPPRPRKDTSNPKLLPKMIRNIVAAVAIVKPNAIKKVCLFRLAKSTIGTEITLIVQ
jgi:hypothetical protein